MLTVIPDDPHPGRGFRIEIPVPGDRFIEARPMPNDVTLEGPTIGQVLDTEHYHFAVVHQGCEVAAGAYAGSDAARFSHHAQKSYSKARCLMANDYLVAGANSLCS